ncbi:MAG: hypothetical protein LBJ14_10305 [Desulfarculales bacterium]|jgi:hypothetical protein|nr:hypothetical protein [Desulfarculales bacterium]
MAKSKEIQTPPPEETILPASEVTPLTPPEADNTDSGSPAPEVELPGPDNIANPAQESATAPLNEGKGDPAMLKPGVAHLLSITELSEAMRLPTWQSAALHRLMGWEPGKMVSEADYKTGLARLKNRRIGG